MFLRTSLAVAALAVAASSAFVAPVSAKTLTAQQQRMATCAKESTGKKGAEHRAFMSSCLKGKTATSGAFSTAEKAKDEVSTTTGKTEAAVTGAGKSTGQRAKMTECNVQAKAKSLKGAERKSFMSSCLKG